MVLIASLIDVATHVAALLMLVAEIQTLLAVAISLIKLPYNLLLLGGILRTIDTI